MGRSVPEHQNFFLVIVIVTLKTNTKKDYVIRNIVLFLFILYYFNPIDDKKLSIIASAVLVSGADAVFIVGDAPNIPLNIEFV